MLVYANSLQIVGIDAFKAAGGSVHRWLVAKQGQKRTLAEVMRPGQWKSDVDSGQSWLQTFVATGAGPEMYSWRLKHVDAEVKGRQWLVEIGAKIEAGVVDFSCTVQTDEMSVLITDPVRATRPTLIRYLLENVGKSKDARFAPGTPGLSLKLIGDTIDSYRALLADIERRDRDYPILLVSPHADGSYLIEPRRLQEALFGLAQVVQVVPEFNSWDMEDVLGRNLSAWSGSLNLIRVAGRDGSVRSSFSVSSEVEGWGGSESDRISAVLARVTHTTNVPKSRKHIRPDGVARLAMVRRMEQQKLALVARSGSDSEMLELYQNELQMMSEHSQRLRNECEDKDLLNVQLLEQNERIEQELREERFKCRRLMHRAQDDAGPTLDPSTLIDIATRNQPPSPRECLDAIQQAYPNRVTVLDSAYDSADDHALFDSGRRLLRLLNTLCTDFIEQMEAGGDNLAKQCFTSDEYAANESKTTKNNREMNKKRTYSYGNRELKMFRHLKVGKADDERLSIRVYFDWLPDERKIVIGHCGEHLPIISH